jgi:hypothetical protein
MRATAREARLLTSTRGNGEIGDVTDIETLPAAGSIALYSLSPSLAGLLRRSREELLSEIAEGFSQ